MTNSELTKAIDHMIFALACEVHWSWMEMLEMPLSELFQFFDFLKEKRDKERKAHEEAQARQRAARPPKRSPSRGGGKIRRR